MWQTVSKPVSEWMKECLRNLASTAGDGEDSELFLPLRGRQGNR